MSLSDAAPPDEPSPYELLSWYAEMGVTEAMMEQVSHAALKDHCHATNPRIASQADYLDILRHAA